MEKRDIPTLEDVFKSFDAIYDIIDLMDATYKLNGNNFLMKFYHNRGISLRDIFTRDILDWLCFLAWEDKEIDINEVMFMNKLLNLNLSQLDVLEIVKRLDSGIFSTLPLSFAIFMEDAAINDYEIDIVIALHDAFVAAGAYFLACDGDVDPNEIAEFELYIKMLKVNICTFDVESLHKFMLENI